MKRIVMFGGGSGSRDLTIALARAGHAVTRVVPAWDSGGSSRALRDAFGMLAVGDIRQALLTLAHGEGRAGGVVRFCNTRLSEDATGERGLAEFDFYAGGAHPLLAAIEPGVRGALLNYLRLFRARLPAGFDFRSGSIGNFVLTGAYLAHGGDIDTAIFVFRKLCAIDGQVWPSTTADQVALSATLRDGRMVHGQDRITALPPDMAAVGIGSVRLAARPGDNAPAPPVNPVVLDAVAAADIITFGPGSLYTSTLPHLLVQGMADALAATGAAVPKVFVANLLECPETTGRSVADAVAAFAGVAGPVQLSHLLMHRSAVPFDRVVHGSRCLPVGDEAALRRWVPCVMADDLEDPWQRGRHDAPRLAAAIGGLADGGPAAVGPAR